MEKESIRVGIIESKGALAGYRAIFGPETASYKSRILLEISLREGENKRGTTALIKSELVVPYTLVHLNEEMLVAEKIQACVTRSKARDFYDLYFIMRSRLSFKQSFIRDRRLKTKIIEIINSQKIDFKRELKVYLPVNQHGIIKDFSKTLSVLVDRNLA
ncbi:MAG: hypothetical protein GF384_01090 [Elusimicrobia bacterium]|nr:hypothetical protein [Elusimicrobiota bacterium]MBD3411632.1 hypothetical protein [Elusimicrobiota bacterium]